MGISAALIGGGALAGAVGNYLQGRSQQRAAETQAQAMREASDVAQATQREFFSQGQAQLSPFQQAGTQALTGLQSLSTPEGQAQALQQYTSSPLYQAIRDQAVETTLRGASATGGLRTGGADVALASISPQLQMQYLQNQQAQLSNLANMGYGAASQGAQQAQQFGTGLSGLQYGAGIGAGQLQAQAQEAVPMAMANTAGQLGGLATYAGTRGLA